MQFGHEKLDVYQASLEYMKFVYRIVSDLSGNTRHAKDQLLRASQSIPLNIAEGNGKGSFADRRRFFEIARGSALECAAIQDVLVIGMALSNVNDAEGKRLLGRIVAMLIKLTQSTQTLREVEAQYGEYAAGEWTANAEFDNDNDIDNDNEK